MIPSRDRANEFDQRDDYAPDPARDGLRIASEYLDSQCRGISARSIISDRAQCENNDTEAPEAAETLITC